MFILPYKADIDLYRFPFLTVLVCLVCGIVFYMQSESRDEALEYTHLYCQQNQERIFHIALKKVYADSSLSDYDNCQRFLLETHNSLEPEKHLDELIENAGNISGQSAEKSQRIISYQLKKKYEAYKGLSVNDLTNDFAYVPSSWNIMNMFSYVFAHADIFHIVGNLFFFFAFSATVEIILGIRFYTLCFALISLGTASLYSVYSMSNPAALPTVGLSGVVYGMMGLFVYFAPRINIRFFVWIFIIFLKFGLPAWLIVGIYFSLDTYTLINSEEMGGVNLVAHVSGGIIGYCLGLLFFRKKKETVKADLIAAGKA